MPAVGVITLELRLPACHSLKEKRQILRSRKSRLRRRHNLAMAEVGYQDLWQRSLLAAVTVSGDWSVVEGVLSSVEREVETMVGGALVAAEMERLA